MFHTEGCHINVGLSDLMMKIERSLHGHWKKRISDLLKIELLRPYQVENHRERGLQWRWLNDLKILLLDEPTTYLDIAHQHEVLELVSELNQTENMTVLMVLHDLNQASQYSDRVIVVQSGEKEMVRTPIEVMTEEMIRKVYHMNSEIQYILKRRNHEFIY